MRAYILIAGSFTDFGGKKYEKGQVVWSDLPLIKSFPGKFRRATQQEAQAGQATPPNQEGDDDVGDDARFFSGRPLPGNQDIPPTPGSDLSLPGSGGGAGGGAGGDAGDEDQGGHGSSTDEGDAPQDVTDDFPKAEKHGLKVVRDQDGYRVLDSDGAEAHEPFKTERGLNNFLTEYGKKK